MEQLNLITTSELKSGTVFYFKSKTDLLEIGWSEFENMYFAWLVNNSLRNIFKFDNLTSLKQKAKELIKQYDLKQTLKP